MARTPEYCKVKDIANWLRIDINPNTDPNEEMIQDFIMNNEDEIDRRTGHSWLADGRQYRNDVMDVNEVYDWGRGMALYLKHRHVKPWDPAKGDKIEIWDGTEFVDQNVTNMPNNQFHIQEEHGVLYIRGFIYTILRKARFRITYRYGSDHEFEDIPRDIRKCCILMTCIDILSQDFKMSQIGFGGEGNINKNQIMDKWKDEVDRIIWSRSEIQTVYI